MSSRQGPFRLVGSFDSDVDFFFLKVFIDFIDMFRHILPPSSERHMMLVCDLSYQLMFLEGVTHLADLIHV